MRVFSKLLLGLVLLGMVSGQLLRLKLGSDSSSALLLIDVANGLYVAFGLVYGLASRKKFPGALSLIFLAGLIGWMVITLMLGSHELTSRELTIAAFYIGRFVLMVGTFIVTAMLVRQTIPPHKLMLWLFLAGLALVGLGYLQLVFVPDFGFMNEFGWDPHEGRLLSTYFDPNYFGMLLIMLSSLALAFFFTTNRILAKLLYSGILAISGGALLLTLSRSAYLALLVSILAILTVRAWKLVFMTMFVVSLIGLSIPKVRTRIIGATQVDATAQDRIQSWHETFIIIQDHPFVGVGYNAFGPAQVKYGFKQDLQGHSSRGSDSSILLVLATTGVIGLIFYLLFWLSLFYEAVLVFVRKKNPTTTAVALATLGIIPAYLVHSQFVNSLFYPLLLIPFFLIVAPVLSAVNPSNEKT